jgi:hypothetical protein
VSRTPPVGDQELTLESRRQVSSHPMLRAPPAASYLVYTTANAPTHHQQLPQVQVSPQAPSRRVNTCTDRTCS